MIRFIVLMSVLLLAGVQSSAAKDVDPRCDAGIFLSLANYVLDNRVQALSPLAARRYGSAAAYLKIRYTPITPVQSENLVLELLKSGARDSDQLAMAYLLNQHGLAGAIERLGSDFRQKFIETSTNISAARGMGLSHERDAYLADVARLAGFDRETAVNDIVVALIDQPEPFKRELAASAEALGLFELAGGMLASLAELSAWDAFVERHKDLPNIRNIKRASMFLPALHGNLVVDVKGAASVGQHIFRAQLTNIMHAAFLTPERDFLIAYMNHFGVPPSGAALALIDTPADRRKTMDEVWLIEYKTLRESAESTEDLDSGLALLPFIFNRHYETNFRDALDWMIAVDALRPYVSREIDAIPERPATLTATFSKWPKWESLAKTIRETSAFDPSTANEDDLGIAAELLFAAGRSTELANVLTSVKPTREAIQMANDFALRSDRVCEAQLERMGEAALIASIPLFKFDPK